MPAGKSIKIHYVDTHKTLQNCSSLCVALRNDLLWGEQLLSWPWNYLRVWLHAHLYLLTPLTQSPLYEVRFPFCLCAVCLLLLVLQQICTLCTHGNPLSPLCLLITLSYLSLKCLLHPPLFTDLDSEVYINRQQREHKVFKALKMAVLCFRGSNIQGSL